MGGQIDILEQREICGEIVGDIQVKYSELKACNIEGEIIPKLIDEIPIIAVLANTSRRSDNNKRCTGFEKQRI